MQTWTLRWLAGLGVLGASHWFPPRNKLAPHGQRGKKGEEGTVPSPRQARGEVEAGGSAECDGDFRLRTGTCLLSWVVPVDFGFSYFGNRHWVECWERTRGNGNKIVTRAGDRTHYGFGFCLGLYFWKLKNLLSNWNGISNFFIKRKTLIQHT